MMDATTTTLLAGAAALVGMMLFGGSTRAPRGGRIAAEPYDPMSPGYGQEDKTYGDARFADFTLPQDAPLMTELFGREDGLFLGWAMGGFDRDWIYSRQRTMNYVGERHGLTCAPTRSGKGTCGIIPNLLLLNRSVVVIDPKGQNAAVTAAYRARFTATYLLNPYDEHGLGTSRFNPLAHLDIDDPNVFADVAGLAEALIITEGKDPHWPDSARNLVAVLILHLLETRGREAALPQVREFLGLPPSGLIEVVKSMMRSKYSFISELAGQFLDTTDEIKNIVSSARTQTKFLSDPRFADPDTGILTGDDFRFADFKKEVSSLYLILPYKHLAANARFLRLMIVSALDQLMTTAGGIKTVFLLDEFKQLGHLSAIESAFSLAAGYNVQIWPFIQNLNQLREVYGETGWTDIISGCGFIQFYAPQDDFTAEYVSRRIGDYTQYVRNTSNGTSDNLGTSSSNSHGMDWKSGNTQHGRNKSVGTSYSESWNKIGMRLATPQNVMALPADKSFVMLNGLKYPVLAFRRPYYNINSLKGCAAPDPFHP